MTNVSASDVIDIAARSLVNNQLKSLSVGRVQSVNLRYGGKLYRENDVTRIRSKERPKPSSLAFNVAANGQVQMLSPGANAATQINNDV